MDKETLSYVIIIELGHFQNLKTPINGCKALDILQFGYIHEQSGNIDSYYHYQHKFPTNSFYNGFSCPLHDIDYSLQTKKYRSLLQTIVDFDIFGHPTHFIASKEIIFIFLRHSRPSRIRWCTSKNQVKKILPILKIIEPPLV